MNFSPLLASPVARHTVLALSLALALPSVMAQDAQKTLATNSTPTAASSSPILARGSNGVVIRVDDVLSELMRVPEAERKAFFARPDGVDQLANSLLVRRALAAEAVRDGLDKDPVLAASVAVARDRVLSIARLAKLDAQNTPSEAALEAQARKIYKDNEAKFIQPAQTRARHILLANTGPDSLQKAKELLNQLRQGASFEDLAKANSTDTESASRGGDLGFFSAGRMVQPFEDALKALAKPGDLSEPVESQFGYHIIRLEARRGEGPQPYEEVRAQLLVEARTGILNEGRIQKVESLNKALVFDRAAIDAFIKSEKR